MLSVKKKRVPFKNMQKKTSIFINLPLDFFVILCYHINVVSNEC